MTFLFYLTLHRADNKQLAVLAGSATACTKMPTGIVDFKDLYLILCFCPVNQFSSSGSFMTVSILLPEKINFVFV